MLLAKNSSILKTCKVGLIVFFIHITQGRVAGLLTNQEIYHAPAFILGIKRINLGVDYFMVFSSLLFIFAFLSVHLLCYYLMPNSKRNHVLLLFSLIFYAWGGVFYLPLLAGEVFVSWLFARAIELDPARKRFWLGICVALLLTCLMIFKYLGFFVENLNQLGLSLPVPKLTLPIGISFYTFQLLSYVVDVYRGQVKAQDSYGKLLLYASLFHQCIAGPIVRYETVAKEIEVRHVSRSDLYEGIRRFSVGLAKKAVLANSCASVADTLLPDEAAALSSTPVLGLWLGVLFYTLQIYLDFSAYSDMAIGLGRMVGFHYLENFNYPYLANSVQDFWRRWHISLSSFFRDYIYIPLGGNRCSTVKYVRNMFVVWLLTGFWHGASWNFILWGLFYFVWLLLEKFLLHNRPIPVFGHIYTLFAIMVGWTIFRFEDMEQLLAVLRGMFGMGDHAFSSFAVESTLTQNVFLLAACIIAVVPLGKWIRNKLVNTYHESRIRFYLLSITDALTPVLMLVLASVSLAGDSYNPFLYFRF